MTLERLAIETEILKVEYCDKKTMVISGLDKLTVNHQKEWMDFFAKVYPSMKIVWD